MAARALTSDDLNAAVFRYLQESGFVHTAFNFFYEAGVDKCDVPGKKIPHGALVTVVQKGLQYIELEANCGVGDAKDFHLFEVPDLLTKDLDVLKKEITSGVKVDPDENAKAHSEIVTRARRLRRKAKKSY